MRRLRRPERGRLRLAAGSSAAGLAVILTAGSAAATFAPHLSGLYRQSRVVTIGRFGAVESLDEGKLLVGNFLPERVVKGSAGAESLCVVEERGGRADAAQIVLERRALLFLGEVETASYYRKNLAGREGCLRPIRPAGATFDATDASDAEALSSAALLLGEIDSSRGRVLRQEPDKVRRFAFLALRARSATLVRDGAATLADLRDVGGSSTPDERSTLEATLKRSELPPGVLVDVIRAIGAVKLEAMVPALRDVRSPHAEVLEAAWAVLAQLGAPIDPQDLAARARSSDAAARVAAVKTLVAPGDASAVLAVEAFATSDPDRQVRLAAIEGLGRCSVPEAIPVLERTYEDSDVEIRQASARAILAKGRDTARTSFERLAFRGPIDAQRYAVAGLLLLEIPLDDPLFRRIRETHPDEGIRELATHGLHYSEH